MNGHSLDAWMSQEYIANFNRGDQSSKLLRHTSLTEEMRDPVTWAMRFCPDMSSVTRLKGYFGKFVTHFAI